MRFSQAAKLANADGFYGKSDPFCKLVGLTGASQNWGETVTVRDNLNPSWNQSYTLPVLAKLPLGGPLIRLCCEVWDEDNKKRGSSE